MAGKRAATRLAELRADIATRLRRLADDMTDGFTYSGTTLRQDLYDIAGRYEAGTETQQDGETLIRLHAFVMQITAPLLREEGSGP